MVAGLASVAHLFVCSFPPSSVSQCVFSTTKVLAHFINTTIHNRLDSIFVIQPIRIVDLQEAELGVIAFILSDSLFKVKASFGNIGGSFVDDDCE